MWKNYWVILLSFVLIVGYQNDIGRKRRCMHNLYLGWVDEQNYKLTLMTSPHLSDNQICYYCMNKYDLSHLLYKSKFEEGDLPYC